MLHFSSSTPKQRIFLAILLLLLLSLVVVVVTLSPQTSPDTANARRAFSSVSNRRKVMQSFVQGTLGTAGTILTITSSPSPATAAAIQDSLDVDTFLRTGVDLGGNMGVSSQAGKSKPETGVVFRDGTDVSQSRQGDVLAEILTGTKQNPKPVLVSFNSPYALERGSVFDIETRDGKTGDGIFVAVTRSIEGKSLADLPSSFFLERLFDPTGRFSFYGSPTDIKVKRSWIEGNNRLIELSFSNLSQSTNAELPRKALLVASIPDGTDNAIMLVGSSTATRWTKSGVKEKISESLSSFRAIPAPRTNMKIRAKERGGSLDL